MFYVVIFYLNVTTSSTSVLPDASRIQQLLRPESHSTSRPPLMQLQEQTSSGSSADSEGSKNERIPKRKNYEAFVMTGERMINLAKTPANLQQPQTAPPTMRIRL